VHRVAAGFLAAGFLAAGFLAGTLAISSGAAGAAGSAATPQEKAQARQALLVHSDLPKGWKSSSNQSSSSQSDEANAQMARCLGVPSSSFQSNPPQVQSPTFTGDADEIIVQNSITIFRSTSFARNEYAAFTNPKFGGCLLALQAGKGSTGTTLATPPHISFVRLPAPKGAASYGYSGSLNGVGNVALVFSFFTHGRFGDEVTTASYGSGTNVQPLAQRLLNVARSRL
jgi:hypothetical protein